MVWMKSRWTPTRWAPKSSTAATEKQRMPLIPTAARRWLIRRVSGWPSRQASKNSAAQATASAIIANRDGLQRGEVGDQPERELVVQRRDDQAAGRDQQQREPDTQRGHADPAVAAGQLRAEPGRTSVIAISARPGGTALAARPRSAVARRPGDVGRRRCGRLASVAPEGKIRCAPSVSPVTDVPARCVPGRAEPLHRCTADRSAAQRVGLDRRGQPRRSARRSTYAQAGSRRRRGSAGSGPRQASRRAEPLGGTSRRPCSAPADRPPRGGTGSTSPAGLDRAQPRLGRVAAAVHRGGGPVRRGSTTSGRSGWCRHPADSLYRRAGPGPNQSPSPFRANCPSASVTIPTGSGPRGVPARPGSAATSPDRSRSRPGRRRPPPPAGRARAGRWWCAASSEVTSRSRAASISSSRAGRWVRRISASRRRRSSSGVSGTRAGTGREEPSASMATNTKYADATCSGSSAAFPHGWASTRTPISMEERPAQLTCA